MDEDSADDTKHKLRHAFTTLDDYYGDAMKVMAHQKHKMMRLIDMRETIEDDIEQLKQTKCALKKEVAELEQTLTDAKETT